MDITAVVLDTSFIIENYPLIAQILHELESESCPTLLIVIPYVMIRELDKLKRSSNHELVKKSMAAERILYQKDSGLQRNLFFQSLGDLKSMDSFHDANNDDLIIECAIFYGLEYKTRIILLSRDNNLCLKAKANGIIALQALPPDPKQAIANIILKARPIRPEGAMDLDTEVLSPNLSVDMEIENQTPMSILSQVENLVMASRLATCIQTLLVKNIGPEWPHLLPKSFSNPNQWTCGRILELINCHWKAVFAADLPSMAHHLATTCAKEWRGLQTSCTASSLKLFCQHLRQLLMAFGIDESERLRYFESIL